MFLQIFLSGQGEFIEDIGFVMFSFFNVIWATVYLESWKRRSAELSYMWGTMDTKGELLAEPRVQYQGQEEISEVTGKPEPTYPDWKRNVFRFYLQTFCQKYVTSILQMLRDSSSNIYLINDRLPHRLSYSRVPGWNYTVSISREN